MKLADFQRKAPHLLCKMEDDLGHVELAVTFL